MTWISDLSYNRFKSTYLSGFLDISGGGLIVEPNNKFDIYSSAHFFKDVTVDGNIFYSGALVYVHMCCINVSLMILYCSPGFDFALYLTNDFSHCNTCTVCMCMI
jgi:hypothetical protein